MSLCRPQSLCQYTPRLPQRPRFARVRRIVTQIRDGWLAFAPSIPGWRTYNRIVANLAESEVKRLRRLRPTVLAEKLDADAAALRAAKELDGLDEAIRLNDTNAASARLNAQGVQLSMQT